MELTGLSIIGMQRSTTGGRIFTATNPANGAPLPGEFHSASPADVENAAQLATKAFTSYAQWSGKRRAALLEHIAQFLESHTATIVKRANLETALPIARLEGELARTCFQLRLQGESAANGLFAGARIDHAQPGRTPIPKPDLRSMMRPIGPVAVFGASNFPLAFSVAGGDTAAALAAGCPVIVKAHPAHPGTSEIVGRVIQEAMHECDAPEGLFSLLFDVGYNVGASLVQHHLIKAVAFTGSRRGGRALMHLATVREEAIPVCAEMSSVNPVFIFRGALAHKADEIANGLQASVSLGVGQFCTNPGLVFIESCKGAARLIDKLKELIAASPAGTMLSPDIYATYQQTVDKFSQITGVRLLAVGKQVSGQASSAMFAADIATFLDNRNLMDEVFGPSTLLIECNSRKELLATAEQLEGQLTATIHATPDELSELRSFVEVLSTKAGRLLFGGFPTGVEVAHAMTHGGPYPATSDGRSTSVGTRAAERFLRPITYQNFPDAALPQELQEANPLKILRLTDGAWKIS